MQSQVFMLITIKVAMLLYANELALDNGAAGASQGLCEEGLASYSIWPDQSQAPGDITAERKTWPLESICG